MSDPRRRGGFRFGIDNGTPMPKVTSNLSDSVTHPVVNLRSAKEITMAKRQATARWNGNLKEGNGIMKYGQFEGPFTFASRFEEGKGTNPEELVGAAHAGCFSMFLAALISGDNYAPTRVETTATVHLGEDGGPKITRIDLACEAVVPGLDADKFSDYAQTAKRKCPISRLFAGTTINLAAKLAD
jgi:osmotically inducible protein OsmC